MTAFPHSEFPSGITVRKDVNWIVSVFLREVTANSRKHVFVHLVYDGHDADRNDAMLSA